MSLIVRGLNDSPVRRWIVVGLCLIGWLPALVASQSPLARLAIAQEANDDEAVFSGPQVGEPLPAFSVQDLLADPPTNHDLGPGEDDDVRLIMFVHQLSRPAIGLVRQLTMGLTKFESPRPRAALIFLTDDPTATRQWAGNARRALPEDIVLGVSLDGPEGPGALGLNRTVAMTILVVKGEEVVGNFALIQPSIQADAPKVLENLCEATGQSWEELSSRIQPPMDPRQAAMQRMDDETFRGHVGPLINREASEEDVARIAAELEKLGETNPAFRARMIEAASRIVSSGRLENYGTPAAQEVLKQWAAKAEQPRDNGRNNPERTAPARPNAPRDQDR